MRILVTGGAGYIGSHACVELLEKGHEIVVVDNLCNSSEAALEAIKKITGKAFPFYREDLRDAVALEKIFVAHAFDCIMHFAGLKAVGESVAMPLEYYENNLGGALNLCKAMKNHGVNKLIFSSSATVYSAENEMPIMETAKLATASPYGRTKLMCEEIFRDFAMAQNAKSHNDNILQNTQRNDNTVRNMQVSIVLLRYFNPIGAHKSGLIGDNPAGIPNNLMPFIAQTAQGKHQQLNIFGDDYPTPDGTCIRDYIHIDDLVKGHVAALDFAANNHGCEAFNLGTGHGVSVFELLRAFESANAITVPYSIAPRRAGDIPTLFASPNKAAEKLGFRAEKSIEEMCLDMWNFQRMTELL